MKNRATRPSLFSAFACLKNPQEVQAFLTDLLTPQEIKELHNRWFIAQLLWEDQLNYKQIASRCLTSTTTVTRVNQYLRKRQHGGYCTALTRLLQP